LIPHLRHLAKRFLEVARAQPLTPAEQAAVGRFLRLEEAGLFWGQPVPDQRHALAAARIAAGLRPSRSDIVRAALLHDVGKRHAPLGIMGRSLASALELLHLPARGRLTTYLDHGRLGAEDLRAAGSEDLVVLFACSHHQSRPDGIAPQDWDALAEADAV
jgi:putative nucleotidyltransferase with HDIG domain